MVESAAKYRRLLNSWHYVFSRSLKLHLKNLRFVYNRCADRATARTPVSLAGFRFSFLKASWKDDGMAENSPFTSIEESAVKTLGRRPPGCSDEEYARLVAEDKARLEKSRLRATEFRKRAAKSPARVASKEKRKYPSDYLVGDFDKKHRLMEIGKSLITKNEKSLRENIDKLRESDGPYYLEMLRWLNYYAGSVPEHEEPVWNIYFEFRPKAENDPLTTEAAQNEGLDYWEYVHREILKEIQRHVRANGLPLPPFARTDDSGLLMRPYGQLPEGQDEETFGVQAAENEAEEAVKITLSPAEEKAYRSWKYAEANMPPEDEKIPTDREAYEWLKEHGPDGYELPAIESWKRYVRAGRRAENCQKNSSRGARTGRSIVRPEDCFARCDSD